MTPHRPPAWKWVVCGLLLFATLLLYMDRQTLAQTSPALTRDLDLNKSQYGRLEFAFGMAFAAGALAFGAVVDRVPVRWLYPFALVGWSLAGCATAFAPAIGERLLPLFADTSQAPSPFWQQFAVLNPKQCELPDAEQWRRIAHFLGFLLCRTVLGIFESGHWPCALVTTQRILTRQELPLGNSILQSGASIGAIITPFVVLACRVEQPGQWPYPFLIVGLVGLLWVVPWLLLIRRGDLPEEAGTLRVPSAVDSTRSVPATIPAGGFVRKLFVCLVVVVAINITWQYFRAWNVLFLSEYHQYPNEFIQWFSAGYYLAADVGCLGVGLLVRVLTRRKWDVHHARLLSFALCCLLTLAGLAVAVLPANWMLLGAMLVVAAGSLGLFPTYYALSQDLSRQHQGKLSGLFGCAAWVSSAVMQEFVGKHIEATKQYTLAIQMAAVAPLVALVVLWLVWPKVKPVTT
jgi:ACS family hexuronate transporter-like MFS transporter